MADQKSVPLRLEPEAPMITFAETKVINDLKIKHGSLIEKEFHLCIDAKHLVLPPASELFASASYIDAEMSTLKDRLNSVKSKLDRLDAEQWRRHTNSMSMTGLVVPILRQS